MDITKLIEESDYWLEADGLEILPEEEKEDEEEKLEESEESEEDEEYEEDSDADREKEVRAESVRHTMEKQIIGESVEDAASSLLMDHSEWVYSV